MASMRMLRAVGSDGTSGKGFLYCESCGQESSANPSDYWHLPDGYEFVCCDEPMAIVRERRILEFVDDCKS